MNAGGSLADATPVGDGSSTTTVQIEINGVQKHLLIEHGLDPSLPDNRIIGAALGQADVRADVRWCQTMRHFASRPPTSACKPQSTARSGAAWRHDRRVGVRTTRVTKRSTASTPRAPSPSIPLPECEQLNENGFAVLRAGSQSALTRRVSDDLVLLPHNAPEPWGLRARSKEQRFALELLLDPDVSVVALDGRAGTGKTLLAIAAGLEQVVETPALRASGRVPPIGASRARRCRVPTGDARREARPVDVGHPRRHRRAHRPAQQQRCHATDRRADRSQPVVARVGHVPARPLAASPDRRRRRGPEPGADDA